MHLIKNLTYTTLSDIDKELLWAFYTKYLNIDLNKNKVHILRPEYDIVNKQYPTTTFNDTTKVNTRYFTKKDLLRDYLKDYKKIKDIKWALEFCKISDVNVFNVGKCRNEGKLPTFNLKKLNLIYEVVGLENKIPYLHNRINYILLDNKNYAAHIKQTKNCQDQYVYRLDIDTHDSYFTENQIDTKHILKELIKVIDRKCNILFPEISVIGSGAHIYIGFNEKGTYSYNIKNLKEYFNNILSHFIDNILEQPEFHNKIIIEIPDKKVMALPLNSVYEYYDIKSDSIIDQITFYHTFIEPSFKESKEIPSNFLGNITKTIFPNLPKKKKYLSLRNIDRVITKQNKILNRISENKVKSEINSTGWEKEKNIKIKSDPMFLDESLLIYAGQRVATTQLIVNKMLSYKHYFYTLNELELLIKNHNVNSKDLAKQSQHQFERDCKAWYAYYERMYNQNSKSDTIKPKNFYSNISLIPDNLNNKIAKISKNLIIREYKNNSYKTKESLESDIVNTELLLKEIIGYTIYISQNNKSKIKSDIKLTKENRVKAESNINLGREWLKALKEHYGLDCNLDRLFKMILDKSGLFEKVYYGNKCYLNLNDIKVATTFNFKIKIAVNEISNVIGKVRENLDLLLNRFKEVGIKHSIMCERVLYNIYNNKGFNQIILDDTG